MDNVQNALALLVLNGGSVHRDALCAALWADARVATSRNSLRTLLARVRAATGLRIEREHDLVVVRDPVWCDVEEFIRTASQAVAASGDPATARGLAVQAQRLWRGAPLEAWRYEPWAAEVRTRTHRLQGALWNLLDTPPQPGAG